MEIRHRPSCDECNPNSILDPDFYLDPDSNLDPDFYFYPDVNPDFGFYLDPTLTRIPTLTSIPPPTTMNDLKFDLYLKIIFFKWLTEILCKWNGAETVLNKH